MLKKIPFDIKDVYLVRILILVTLSFLLIDSIYITTIAYADVELGWSYFVFFALFWLCPILLLVVVILCIVYSFVIKGIKKLNSNGYLVPWSAKDYRGRLDILSEVEKKKFTERYPVSKKYLTIAAIVITVCSGFYTLTFAKMIHFIILPAMILFMIYYIVAGNTYYYKEELDKKASSDKRIKRGYVLRVIEFVIIYGGLLTNLFVADYYLLPEDSLQYDQAISYYKRTEPEKYRLFPDEIPNSAHDYFQDFYMSDDDECYVYFRITEGDIQDYCEYYESLDESYIKYTVNESGYKKVYEGLQEDISYKLCFPQLQYSSDEPSVIYKFDRWMMAPTGNASEYYSMYVWVGLECNEVLVGYSLE